MPRVIGPIEEHDDFSHSTLTAPVVATIAVVPPVAGKALGADGARDGNALAAPCHHSGDFTVAEDVGDLGGLECSACGGDLHAWLAHEGNPRVVVLSGAKDLHLFVVLRRSRRTCLF